MATDRDDISAHPIPTGAYLEEELAARDISVGDFATDIGVAESWLRAFLAGSEPLTPDTAARLESALGLSAELWLGLEADYRSALAQRAAVIGRTGTA